MDNQSKFIQYLIEDITKESNELRIQLTHLKINLRITDEIIQEQNTQIQELVNANQQISKSKDELETYLVKLNSEKQEFENTKHQVAHLETFRNELVRVTQERDNLAIQNVDLLSKLEESFHEITELRNRKIQTVEIEPVTPAVIRKRFTAKKTETNDF